MSLEGLKILALSDSHFVGSGFGEEIRQLIFRWAREGAEVFMLGLQNIGFDRYEYDYQYPDLAPHTGAKVRLCTLANPSWFGQDVIQTHYEKYQPDILFFFGDVRRWKWANKGFKQQFPCCIFSYATLDGVLYPDNPIPQTWKPHLDAVDVLVCMSDWGRKQYEKSGWECVHIPHGINYDYVKRTEKTQDEMMMINVATPEGQQLMGDFRTRFFTAEVNQHRKNYPDLLLTYDRFSRDKVKEVYLYLHCALQSPELGWDLVNEYIKPLELFPFRLGYSMGIAPIMSLDPDELLKTFHIGNVYINTSTGEGFSKNLLYAQAMGMPVIATNCTAIPEVVGEAGFLVDVRTFHRPISKLRGVRSALIDTEDLELKMRTCFNHPDLVEKLGQKGRERAEKYDYDAHIIPRWVKLFNETDIDSAMIDGVLNL